MTEPLPAGVYESLRTPRPDARLELELRRAMPGETFAVASVVAG